MTIDDNILWYKKSADEWLEALPIGNGRIGVMIFGNVFNERLALSETTVWSGKEEPSNDNKKGPELLAEIQKALLPPRAPDKILYNLLDNFQGGIENFGTSRPFGDLFLEFINQGEISNYKRWLDLKNAIAFTEYTLNDISFKREIFASNPAQVVVMKITASENASIDFNVNLKPIPYRGGTGSIKPDHNSLIYDGLVYDGFIKTHARIAVINTGGQISIDLNGLHLSKADEVILFLSLATTFNNNDPYIQCKKDIADAIDKGFSKLKSEHIIDFSSQFCRLELCLGDDKYAGLPTDERVAMSKSGVLDPDFDKLWYQYARYLTISASRKNSPLPMHLQGIWNDNLAANMCWTCDFHIDINIQMNQWISTSGNLPEGNIALGNFIKNILMPSGKRTARVQYGKRGWVAHTVTNAWGYSSFINAIWCMFPTAGAWVASSLWDQYEFFKDRYFLKDTVYPVLKEAALFFIDFLIDYPSTGYVVTAPACSPEHGEISIMPTCDRVIIYSLFDSVIKASEILNIDSEFREEVYKIQSKLPPLEISPKGQLKEWYEDNISDGITGHRHFSHLLALYPYEQITYEDTPELLKAAEISIDRRVSAADWEETEFSGANLAAFYARMKDGNKAFERINIVRKKLTAKNLFTMSPKGVAGAETDIFIIDGNMGIAAAMSEMLLQSYKNRLEFLPALPDHWSKGFIKGIVARGAFEIEMSWSNFVLDFVRIISKQGNICNIKRNNALNFKKFDIYQVEMNTKTRIEYKTDEKMISFNTIKGKTYEISRRYN